MLSTLITSKTRVKLLLKFFLNPENRAYLRNLETEFGDSTNSIRVELNKLEDANMLLSEMEGNKKIFKVNKRHPLFDEINRLIKRQLGISTVIENVVERLGNLEIVYLTGDLAKGLDNENIELILIGKIDAAYLKGLIHRAEELIKKNIKYRVLTNKELLVSNTEKKLLLWNKV